MLCTARETDRDYFIFSLTTRKTSYLEGRPSFEGKVSNLIVRFAVLTCKVDIPVETWLTEQSGPSRTRKTSYLEGRPSFEGKVSQDHLSVGTSQPISQSAPKTKNKNSTDR